MNYWTVILIAPVLLGVTLFLSVWLLAHTNIIFGFIKEGRGAFVMSGESFERALLSFNGHRIEEMTVNGKKILEITAGETESEGLILDWLRKEFGIYYFGLYPFKRRLIYKFRWNEWFKKSVSGELVEELNRREFPTDFFYAQTFPYALVLKAAETGGVKAESGDEEIAGNLSVDMSIVLLVKIVRPQVAILQTEDWFDSLGATVIHQARLYVGEHTFDQLRSQEHKEGIPANNAKIFVPDEFCEHIMKLNVHAPIGDNIDDSIIDAYGVKIIGAQILRIDIAGDKDGTLAKATTEAYRKQQEAIGMRQIVDADAYGIEKRATAESIGLRKNLEVMTSYGDDGKFFVRQDALKKGAQSGSVVVFTNDTEHGGLSDKALAGFIIPQQLKKGAPNDANKKAT